MAIQYRVTATALTVRATPDIQGAVTGHLQKDDIVNEVTDPQNGYWRRVRRNDGLEGFSSQKYLLPIGAPSVGDRFPWMPIARGELGVAEVLGPASNPRIVEFLQSTTLPDASADTNATPWCSGFVNWCVEKAGIAGTDSAVARSWLGWGKQTTAPVEGCIAVFKRDGGKGHVGFFLSQTATKVKLLGGNQPGDVVSIADSKQSDLLGFRTLP